MNPASLGTVFYFLKVFYAHYNPIQIISAVVQLAASVVHTVHPPSHLQGFPKMESLQGPYIFLALLLMMVQGEQTHKIDIDG